MSCLKTVLSPMPLWPTGLPCRREPVMDFQTHPYARLSSRDRAFAEEIALARRMATREAAIVATGITTTYEEMYYVYKNSFTAHANSSAEVSLLVNTPDYQPTIPAFHFYGQGADRRGVSILARGVLGTTSTPTITFQLRLGETVGAAYLSGPSLGVSAAITTLSGVSNQWWELRYDLICTACGIGSNKATLEGVGYVDSPGGFASPFKYPLIVSQGALATWTQTFNAGVTNYLNLSATWSAANASNTITCKQFFVGAFG